METFFLACFLFGALFTAASALLGMTHLHAGSEGGNLEPGMHEGASHGPGLHAPHLPHVPHGQGPAVHAGGHGPHGGSHGHAAEIGHGRGGDGAEAQGATGGVAALPLLNASTILAFITWFGAAGYVLVQFGGWPGVFATGGAVVAGAGGATLVAFFLAKVLAGERVMDPADYRLEGQMGRVSVTIPANGVGEIIFSLAGARRSEAARSLSGQPIPRGKEVVIIDYQRGIALVQPWDELVGCTSPAPSETNGRQVERND